MRADWVRKVGLGLVRRSARFNSQFRGACDGREGRPLYFAFAISIISAL